jgi:hypothetical protein
LDLRYAIPDRLAARSNGAIADDGYDYGKGDSPFLFIFLQTDDMDQAASQVLDFLCTERLLENDLTHGTVVAALIGIDCNVIYPRDFAEKFTLP